MKSNRIRRAALGLALAAAALAVHAEQADKDKPTNIEANRMSADDVRRVTIFEGDVLLTKGTIAVRADRIVVRQDPEGYQISVATGDPVRFRQKSDPRGDKEGVWLDGEALRVEIDDRNERVELYDNAYVKRDEDEVRGEYIFIDQRSDFFSVMSGKSGPVAGTDGRVRAVIQPKNKPENEPNAAAGTKPKPRVESTLRPPSKPYTGSAPWPPPVGGPSQAPGTAKK